ncbi:MAG: 16S rRNA processing protein RimM [Armatimonadetes bacterium]|nr:16S rRNA processing protein RimM [Armatimonadota bacterium]
MSAEGPQIQVGQVVGTHGVKGGLKVYPLTDFPERFDAGEFLYLKGEKRRIKRSSWHKSQVRIQLDGIEDMTTAEGLRGEYLTVLESDRPEMDEDQYLERDLVGMEVRTTDGRVVGRLEEIVHGPAQDLFRIGDSLVPAVPEFVKEIDLEARTITIHVIPGLLDLDEAEEVR